MHVLDRWVACTGLVHCMMYARTSVLDWTGVLYVVECMYWTAKLYDGGRDIAPAPLLKSTPCSKKFTC